MNENEKELFRGDAARVPASPAPDPDAAMKEYTEDPFRDAPSYETPGGFRPEPVPEEPLPAEAAEPASAPEEAGESAPAEPDPPEKKPRRWTKKHTLRLVGGILGVLLLLAAAGWLILHRYLSKINYSDGVRQPEPAALEAVVPEEPGPEGIALPLPDGEDEKLADSDPEEIDEADRIIDENLRREREAEENTPEITNILLIGSDTRVAGAQGRSDTMLLLTVNRRTETLSLTSLLRDMYVYIPGYGNRRINTAFALGGEALLRETIETNFDIDIDYYATIDFYSFIAAIDALGGVRLDISQQEFYGVNYAIGKYNKDLYLPYGDGYLTEYGEGILLNGKQTLGYVRNRQFTDGDFSRTHHQRLLARTLFAAVQEAGLLKLDALLNAFLPGITTDIPESQMLYWMVLENKILRYELKTGCIPVEGSYRNITVGGANVLSIDFETNRQALHDIIHAEKPAA